MLTPDILHRLGIDESQQDRPRMAKTVREQIRERLNAEYEQFLAEGRTVQQLDPGDSRINWQFRKADRYSDVPRLVDVDSQAIEFAMTVKLPSGGYHEIERTAEGARRRGRGQKPIPPLEK